MTNDVLPEEVETALKDLQSEAITQGWGGVNDRNLQYANDAVREAISKAIATELERQRQEYVEAVDMLTRYQRSIHTADHSDGEPLVDMLRESDVLAILEKARER